MMHSNKKLKRKLSIVFREPSEVYHRKGNYCLWFINLNIGINSMTIDS
jgi:hypothetical protein